MRHIEMLIFRPFQIYARYADISDMNGWDPRYVDPVTGQCRDRAVRCRHCGRGTFALDSVCQECFKVHGAATEVVHLDLTSRLHPLDIRA